MKINVPLSAAIAIVSGLTVLAGYFLEIAWLDNLHEMLLEWAIILAAIAFLVGIANLVFVHWSKASSGQKGSFYSAILVIAMLVTLVVVGYLGPTAKWSLWLFDHIQLPVESSLLAMMVIVLAYAGIRLLRRRLNLFSAIFIGTGLLMLLGAAPLFGVLIPGLHGAFGLRNFIAQIPAVAGARGILLGVGLGTVATGLRILMGADRPYRG